MRTKEETKKRIDIKRDLRHFCGTEHYYRHWQGFNYTDGVKYLAKVADCYWLLDLIGNHQLNISKEEHFQTWDLLRTETALKDTYFKKELQQAKDNDMDAVVICNDGNNNILAKQEIPFTDFPLDSIRLFFIDGVLLLTSEY